MGQESSLLPRNPYENYPNKLSNHNHNNHHQQKFISSDSEHYSNLGTTNFNIKSKLNLSTSTSTKSTNQFVAATPTIPHQNPKKYNSLYQEKLPTTSTLYGTCYINKTWKSLSPDQNNNNITIVDQIPKSLPPPPPPLPCSQFNRSNTNTDLGFDRYQRIKKSTSRSSFASYTDYSSCYCSSNSSALSSASKKSQEKQANYLNHHLYIKSYLDILEEDEKAKKKFQLRPGIRNYTPKILNSNSNSGTGIIVKNQKDLIDICTKEPDIWI